MAHSWDVVEYDTVADIAQGAADVGVVIVRRVCGNEPISESDKHDKLSAAAKERRDVGIIRVDASRVSSVALSNEGNELSFSGHAAVDGQIGRFHGVHYISAIEDLVKAALAALSHVLQTMPVTYK